MTDQGWDRWSSWRSWAENSFPLTDGEGTTTSSILNGLVSSKRPEREAALSRLRGWMSELPAEGGMECLTNMARAVLTLCSDGGKWEARLGGCCALRALWVSRRSPPGMGGAALGAAITLLTDAETRVRTAAAELLALLAGGPDFNPGAAAGYTRFAAASAQQQQRSQCRHSVCVGGGSDGGGGLEVWRCVRGPLMSAIAGDFQRGEDRPEEALTLGSVLEEVDPSSVCFKGSYTSADVSMAGAQCGPGTEGPAPYDCGDADARCRMKATNLIIDTEGWHSLETSFRALLALSLAVGKSFAAEVDEPLLRLLYTACSHANRFVRESSMFALGQVVSCLESPQLSTHADEVSMRIAIGMADNWSQVRWAGTVACRQFLLAMGDSAREWYWRLLPRLVLNGHYPAEGVRVLAMQTYSDVLGEKGRDELVANMEQTSSYLISQAKSDNHIVREAACHCIADIASRIEPSATREVARPLAQALLLCFKDESWPVRDAAALACADFAQHHATELGDDMVPQLVELWLMAVCDHIPSVRSNAADATATAARALGEAVTVPAWSLIESSLLNARDEPSVGDVGAAKRERDNDPHLHERRSTGGEDRRREQSSPWERSDGALHLWRALSPLDPGRAAVMLPNALSLGRLDHFLCHDKLRETLWTCVPCVLEAVGKHHFRSHLEELMPELERALRSGNPLTQNAASEAGQRLSRLLGPTTFAARAGPSLMSLLGPSVAVQQASPFSRPPIGSFPSRSPPLPRTASS